MSRRSVCATALLILTASIALRAQQFEWQTATPQSQGMSTDGLERLRADLAARATTGLIVIRHDKIVLEWYSPDSGPGKPHGTASLAKAIVGGMSLAVAMQDGRLKPDDPAARFIPEWRDDPRKSKITIAQLATHSSGLDDAEENKTSHDKLAGWKGEFWRREPTDPFRISRDLTPLIADPGTRVRYSNPGIAMLAYAVTAAIQPGEQKDIRTLLRDRIYRPVGIGDNEWSVGYGKTYGAENLPLVATWGGGAFTARATARIGRLMLHEGDWGARRLLDPAIVRACIDGRGGASPNQWEGPMSPRPGFGWWTNLDRAWPSVPRDAFVGAGAGHQLLVVIPSLDLIAVRNGSSMGTDAPNWMVVEKRLLTPLVGAVTDLPAKPSDVIRKIRFAPPDSIIRKAIDSDNWPMTWGDDGFIYSAYGDGRGFEPFIERKLSLGLARIEGDPPDVHGVNVQAASAERVGDGVKGPKASGMLMVGGVLYMWVRNTANATLAWSVDHGATWTWGFRFDTSFGCPAFLNFGANYAGAADEYVYVYSQDGPGAYEAYDGVVLARVHKDRLRDRDAYEFFVGLGEDGKASWAREIARRGHTLDYPAHCERLDVVYSGALRRYLMALSFGHGKGWGVFDAAQPWGPWTVAFITSDWGLGETHGYRLPAKWISADGQSMWLVFSGRRFNGIEYDAFCLRHMALELYDSRPRAKVPAPTQHSNGN
jgi:CubicO group peptidase (beta-lactamase class C family)